MTDKVRMVWTGEQSDGMFVWDDDDKMQVWTWTEVWTWTTGRIAVRVDI